MCTEAEPSIVLIVLRLCCCRISSSSSSFCSALFRFVSMSSRSSFCPSAALRLSSPRSSSFSASIRCLYSCSFAFRASLIRDSFSACYGDTTAPQELEHSRSNPARGAGRPLRTAVLSVACCPLKDAGRPRLLFEPRGALPGSHACLRLEASATSRSRRLSSAASASCRRFSSFSCCNLR